MDRTVERLIVAVGAKTDGASMRRALGAYSALSAGIIAAGAAVGAFSVAQAASIDRTAKAARALSLSTEEYTELAFAADRSGASIEQLGTGLRGLQTRIAAANAGSKEAVDSFRRIGIAIRDDVTGELLTASDLLPQIADVLSGMSEGEQQALLPRLLGESGAALLPLLQDGSAGIEALTDRAAALGVTLDSETAAAGERLTDSMTDLRGALGGMGRQIAGVTMPAVADFADGLTDVLTESDGIVQVGLDRAMRLMGLAMDFAATPAGKAAGGISAVGLALGAVRGAPGLIQGISTASPMLGGMAGSLGTLARTAGPPAVALALVALVIDDMIVTAQGGDSVIMDLAESLGVGEETAALFAGAGEVLTAAWEAVPAVMRGVGSVVGLVVDEIREALSALAIEFPLLTQLFESFQRGARYAFDGTVGAMSDAAEGYRELALYAAGDESVELSGVQGGILAGAAAGFAGAARADVLGTDAETGFNDAFLGSTLEMRRAEYRRGMDDRAGASVGFGGAPSATAPVSLSLTVSSDPRRAAREAGRETKRQVFQALSTLESM